MRMGRWSEYIFGGTARFRLNFLRIASANAVAQAIGLISLPILSRLYDPADFGVLTTYTLVQSILLSVVTGKVEWIIPNEKNDRQVRCLISLGLVLTAFLFAIVAASLALIGPQLALFFDFDGGENVLWLLPLGVLAGSVQLLWQAWYVFDGDLWHVANSKFAQALSTTILSLILGFVAKKGGGLVIAYVFGFLVASIVLFLGKGHGIRLKNLYSELNFFGMLSLYGRQMLTSTALGVVNMAVSMSLAGLLIFFYDKQVVGWYGLVFRAVTAPIGLVSAAVVQSFWADAAAMAKGDPLGLRQFYIGSIKRLAVLSIPFALASLSGPFYVPIIFGQEEWSGAGKILMALTPYLVGMIIFSPTTHLIVYKKAHWQLLCDLSTLVLSVVSFAIVASMGYEAWVAVAASSVVLGAGYLLRFWVHLRANQGLISRVEIIGS
jgi:O-antigen/teichoic acid export membrane protein